MPSTAAGGSFFGDHPGRPDPPAVGHRRAKRAFYPPGHPPGGPSRGARGSPRRMPAATWRPCSRPGQELDGDEWVINQAEKVWTTQAQFADYIFLLARTDPDAPKHAGISYLLVPMKQAGNPASTGPAHRAGGRVVGVQRGLLRQCPLPEGERGGRRQQRLEGGDDHARLRAGPRPPPGIDGFCRASSTPCCASGPRPTGRASRPPGPPATSATRLVEHHPDHGDQRLPHPHRRAARHPPPPAALKLACNKMFCGPRPTSRRWTWPGGHPRPGRPRC